MTFIYFINALFCAIIMIYIWIKCIISGNIAEYHRHFEKCVMSAFVLCVLECVFAISRLSGVTDFNFNFIKEALYFATSNYFCYRCYRFLRRAVRFDAPKMVGFQRTLSKVPVVIVDVLIVLSYKFGFIFTIDANGDTVHGPFYPVYLLFTHGYVLYALLENAVVRYTKNDISVKRIKHTNVIVISCLAVTALQILPTGGFVLPLATMGITLAVFLLYSDMTDTIVGYDTLTYVHTKNYAMDELAKKFTTDADFYLVMIDADRFKYINDNFGHLEGDRTLSVIGNMLNEVCKDHVAVPARFGGDEFCIISDFEPSAIIGELREKIANSNTPDSKYEISISVGVAKKTSEVKDKYALIDLADAKMYEDKESKKELLKNKDRQK